jgi:hypothetical protein
LVTWRTTIFFPPRWEKVREFKMWSKGLGPLIVVILYDTSQLIDREV